MRTPKEPTLGEALLFGVVVGHIMALWPLVALGALGAF